MKNRVKLLILLIILTVGIALDQGTKIWAVNHLRWKPMQSFFFDTFRLIYAENRGAFLSMFANLAQPFHFLVLSLFPLLMLAVILVVLCIKLRSLSVSTVIAFSCILSGGISNVVLGRFFNNSVVVDFMNFGIGKLRTGILNVADLFIFVGIVLYMLSSILSEHKKKTDSPLQPHPIDNIQPHSKVQETENP